MVLFWFGLMFLISLVIWWGSDRPAGLLGLIACYVAVMVATLIIGMIVVMVLAIVIAILMVVLFIALYSIYPVLYFFATLF